MNSIFFLHFHYVVEFNTLLIERVALDLKNPFDVRNSLRHLVFDESLAKRITF